MKRKILSLALSLALCAATLPTSNIFAIETLENGTSIVSTDKVTHTEDAEKTRYIVMFKDKPVSATTKKYTKKSKKLEEEAFKTQKDSIKKIEKITKTKVKRKNTFLVNACSIDATYEEAMKIKKLDNVADCYEAFTYTPCQTETLDLSDSNTSIYNNDKSLDGEGTIISIIDTGVDYEHLDLLLDSSKKTKNSYKEMMSKIDNLGYGSYINEKVPFAYNYAERCNPDHCNINLHGTHVAGIASANTKTSTGITGVAPNSQILAMQVFPDSGEYTYTDDIVQAIEDSVKLGADAINISISRAFGFSDNDPLELNAVNSAYNSGCIISASAGNNGNFASNPSDGYNNPYNMYDTATIGNPAIFPNSIAVAGCEMNPKDSTNIKIYDKTSWGPTPELKLKPEITAPAVNIRSLAPNNEYEIESGTSMATPYISGVAALVKQSINEKELNLSGSSLSAFIKNSIMNTATPLMDYTYANGTVPYSVRQQGSGLVNIQNAINNNVIATYNGNAKIELGNIEEGKTSIPIEIKLTNYGKTDESYTLMYSPVYTETNNTPTKDKGVCLTEMERSNVTFSDPEITVKAGETITVKGQIDIAPGTAPNQYIESFIKLNNVKDDISLSLPVLGFYGDWDMLPIFDSPSGSEGCLTDAYGSNIPSTLIVNKDNDILGVNKDKEFNIERSAISLDPASNNEIAIPLLTHLRNVYSVDVSVVDSNNQLIQNIGTYKYIRKTKNSSRIPFSPIYIGNNTNDYASWNGTMYDEKTNTTVPVKDGQYYFLIKAKHTKNAPYQTYKLPIQVDSKAPDVDIKFEYDYSEETMYFDVLKKDNSENINTINFYLQNYVFDYIHDSITFNYNKNYELLDNGYRRFTMKNLDYRPGYIEAKVTDYARNTNRICVFDNLNLFDRNNEQENSNKEDIGDTKGPVVDITTNNNLTKNTYKHAYGGIVYDYNALIIDKEKDVELTFKTKDQSEIKSPTFSITTQEINKNRPIQNTIELQLDQIDSSTYKIILSPEDLKNTYEIAESNDKFVYAKFSIDDEFYNETVVCFNLYFSENDYKNHTSKDTKAIKTNITNKFTLKKEDLNPDNTYTITLDVINTDFDGATINFVPAEIIYPEDYEYTNIPSRTVKIKANIPIEVGKNYYTVRLFKDGKTYTTTDMSTTSRTMIYKKSYGTILYNGDNISFDVNSKSPIIDNVYLCNGDNFDFNLDINSKINALNISINNSIVHSYDEVYFCKDNDKISMPLSYKLKGTDINTLKITVVDICGNKSEKNIKVKNNKNQSDNDISVQSESIQYKDINDLSIKLASQNTYTGKKIKPTVSIKDGNYKLVKNTDYKVIYTNNKKIGKAKVKITGINKYKGIVNKTFKIVPKKSSIIKVSNNNHGKTTIKVKKVKGNVKYEIFYSTKKNGKYKKLSTSNKPVLITNKLKRNKNYFIKVRTYKIVKKKKLKCKFSKAKKIKL